MSFYNALVLEHQKPFKDLRMQIKPSTRAQEISRLFKFKLNLFEN